MRFRIYALTEPDGAPRYVGQTGMPVAERFQDHLRVRGQSARAEWIRSLVTADQMPGLVVLEEINGTRRDAYAAETRWIRDLRQQGHSLLNVP